jgi:hypothetical protein
MTRPEGKVISRTLLIIISANLREEQKNMKTLLVLIAMKKIKMIAIMNLK